MARDLDAGTAADIGAGVYAVQWTMVLDIGGTLFGFWGGRGPLDIDGQTYVGAGSLLEIQALDSGVDLSASPITVRLRAVANSTLDPDLLGTIDDYEYKNARVRLALIYFDRATGQIAATLPWWAGYVDTIEHDHTVGGDYALVGHFEPRSLDHSRSGYRMNADADQKLIDPTDRFFEHAATTGTEKLPYGRATLNDNGGAGGSGKGRS